MKIKSDLLKTAAIRCKNQAENDAAILVMSMLSGEPVSDCLLPGGSSYEFSDGFPLACIADEGKPAFWREGGKSNVYDFSNIHIFLTDIQEAEIIVRLNDKHTAVVSKNGIQVGCQTFPLEVVMNWLKQLRS